MGGLEIVLVGPGAIGSSVAAALTQAGSRPVLASRTPVERLAVSVSGSHIAADVECLTDPSEVPTTEVMFLAVKAHQTASVAQWLHAMAPQTVFILQNGVEHVERVSRYALPDAELVPVVASLPATRRAPGVVTVSGDARLTVPRSVSGDRMSRLLAGSFIEVEVSDDWLTVAWEKLMENAAFGGLGVLGLTSNRSLCSEPALRDLLGLLMEEVAAVGRAAGAHIPETRVQEILRRVCDGASDKMASIVVDRLAGSPSEWDARNGVVGRLGRRYEIATPVNDRITSLIRLGEPPPSHDASA